MVLNLLIKTSENLGSQTSSLNIARSTSLEIEPRIVFHGLTRKYLHTHMIHHKYEGKDESHSGTYSKKGKKSVGKSEMREKHPNKYQNKHGA